jgi:alkylation response protein AidB-like acyl-CoA dehydrogenase
MDPHVSPPAASARTDADVVAAARSLIPQVLAARDECERVRHVPTPMVEALAEAGLLQMYLPRSMGGPELPPLVVFRVVEEISRADGSIGWCTMIATGVSNSMGLLEAEVGREMAGCPADMRLAGFASGVNHARWLMCPCVIWDDGKPVRTPTGAPMTRIFWAPAESATIQDTWHVVGLRGTGSHDFTLADVFVPAARSVAATDLPREKGLLYDPRLHLTWIWTATAGNAMGIGRGALDAFVDLASSKSTTMSTTLLRDRPLVQARVAEAEATLSAARAYVQTAVGDLWERAGQGEGDLDVAVVQARLAIARGMHEAVRAVDLLFHAAGTNAVYERNPLERHFRNIHVAIQHAAALPAHMEAAGKVLLGLRPSDAGW